MSGAARTIFSFQKRRQILGGFALLIISASFCFVARSAIAANQETTLRLSVVTPSAPPIPHVLPGNGEAFFFWSQATSTPGVVLNNYEVGRSLASGGPYIFTHLGSTTQSSVSELTNGTRYYFVLRVKNQLGAVVGTSTEFSVVPTASIYETRVMEFTPEIATTTSIVNQNGTRHEVFIPKNLLSASERLFMDMQAVPKSALISDKPLPSGKLAANTWLETSFRKYADNSTVSAVDEPVTITFYYTDADVSGIDESTLGAYRWDGSAWQLISGSTADPSQNKVTFSSTHFSTFTIMGTAPAPASTPTLSTNSGSGGGGGGGSGGGFYAAPETKIVFSGRAYPGMKVTILKDAQIAAQTLADPAANFRVLVSGLSAGQYIFGVYSEDNRGMRSSLLTFPVAVTSGVTVEMGGIFIAPTIAVDKSEVKRGENLAIFGQSAPGSEVTIAVNSDEEFFGKVAADKDGAYLYNFDTADLLFGDHTTKAKAAKASEITAFGKSVAFRVGTKTVLAPRSSVRKTEKLKEDINSDGRVNLIDYSILAFWYKKQKPPANVDFNGDGKVNLVDFSILAYRWSG